MDETFQEQPVLTFEPFADEPSASLQKAEPAQAPTEAPVFDESSLSPEERKMVDDFAAKIELCAQRISARSGICCPVW